MSSPEGGSVNDGISSNWCSLSYASIDDAAKLVVAVGRGALLAKLDIESAYRIVPVHPNDRHLLGMRWKGTIYVDKALPFGLCSAPKLFTAVADALAWMMQGCGACKVIHYLDDFLFVGKPVSSLCAEALQAALRLCRRLGVPVAMGKLQGPATSLTFLGIEMDTEAMELRLP